MHVSLKDGLRSSQVNVSQLDDYPLLSRSLKSNLTSHLFLVHVCLNYRPIRTQTHFPKKYGKQRGWGTFSFFLALCWPKKTTMVMTDSLGHAFWLPRNLQTHSSAFISSIGGYALFLTLWLFLKPQTSPSSIDRENCRHSWEQRLQEVRQTLNERKLWNKYNQGTTWKWPELENEMSRQLIL